MSVATQLYRFKIELADITRNIYDSLDFRVAMHPSESEDYLLTRVLAYALNVQEDLNFSPEGLHNPDEPALRKADPYGGDRLWIEIGNPGHRKLHKAAKSSRTVKVYTYKNPALLIEEMRAHDIHRAKDIEIYSFPQEFLNKLAEHLQRETRWSLTHDESMLMITTDKDVIEGEMGFHQII